MSEVGRPTALTDELKVKIRELTQEGKTHADIAAAIGVPTETFRSWIYRNYQDIQATIRQARHDYLLSKADENIEHLLDSEDEKVKLSATVHVQETLGKKWYSKRQELTGAEGTPLIVAGEVAEKHQLGNRG